MNKPRLIDANKLDREDLCDVCSCAYCADCFSDENFEEWIKNQPTAYDIDEIVEELEKAAKIYRDKAVIELSTEGHTLDYEHFEGKSKAFLNAIEIVKGGGKHDD